MLDPVKRKTSPPYEFIFRKASRIVGRRENWISSVENPEPQGDENEEKTEPKEELVDKMKDQIRVENDFSSSTTVEDDDDFQSDENCKAENATFFA